MWPADRADRRWLIGLAALLAGALALRLVGIRHGLPFAYNADENAHFVPRAIGMFGHGYNPGYFVNPPAYTYLLHAAFELRWTGRADVGEAFAADRGTVFTLARVLAALLGTAAVGLLAWAGRLLIGRGAGLVAAALLAVAFLPVHYSHLALNDAPALAPLCLALVGVALVYRRGRPLDYVLAGAALGVAAATKYTAGAGLACLVAAAVVSEAPARERLRGLALAGAACLAGFLVANPYALLDFDAFRAGLGQQSDTTGEEGGKLGITQENGIVYYLGTLTWGLGWLPALAALGGAAGLALRDRRLALVLVPAPLLFLLFMGLQERFFARWLLPAYPLLCLLAAWAVTRLPWRRPAVVAAAVVLLCAQGLVFSLHNDVVLARTDTRQLARDWMVANVPPRSKVVIEPFVPAAWAWDPPRPSDRATAAVRWNKWPTLRSIVNNDGTIRRGRGRIVRFEDYERTLRPEMVGAYARGGYCWVVTGSTQYGRAHAEPAEVPNALRYYEELARRGELVYSVRPYADGGEPRAFSFDFSFNAYPLHYERPGPEVRIYRLRGGKC
jgi:hypothetical protein